MESCFFIWSVSLAGVEENSSLALSSFSCHDYKMKLFCLALTTIHGWDYYLYFSLLLFLENIFLGLENPMVDVYGTVNLDLIELLYYRQFFWFYNVKILGVAIHSSLFFSLDFVMMFDST